MVTAIFALVKVCGSAFLSEMGAESWKFQKGSSDHPD